MLQHHLFLRDQEDQVEDKEVKILMEQVYLVVTHHQYHHHKVIMVVKVDIHHQQLQQEALEAVEVQEQ